MGRPKLQIVRIGGSVRFYLDGRCLDETAPGRDACHAAVSIARELARVLGADVEDATDPDSQPYTYFIAYDWTGRGGGHGVGSCWITRPAAIEGPVDTGDVAATLVRDTPRFKSVIITSFVLIDGPS